MKYREHNLSHLGKRVIAILLVFMLSFSIFIVPASAAVTTISTSSMPGFLASPINAFHDEGLSCLVYYSIVYDYYYITTFSIGATHNTNYEVQFPYLKEVAGVTYITNTGNSSLNGFYYMDFYQYYPNGNSKTLSSYTGYTSSNIIYADADNVANMSICYSDYPIYGYDYVITADLDLEETDYTGSTSWTEPINVPEYLQVPCLPGYAVSFVADENTTYAFPMYSVGGDFIGQPTLASVLSTTQAYNVSDGLPLDNRSFLSDTIVAWSLEKSGFLQKITKLKTTLNIALNPSASDTFTFFNHVNGNTIGTAIARNGIVWITYDDRLTPSLKSIVSNAGGFSSIGLTTTPITIGADGSLIFPEYLTEEDAIGGNIGDEDPGTYVDDLYPSDFNADTNDGSVIENALNSLKEFLVNLLQPGIDVIETLTSAGSDFMIILSDMFTWLPSDIMSVLVSALILIIVIGTLKFFLGR